VLPLAQALEGQTELLRRTAQRIDEFQRASIVPTSPPSMLKLPRIYLWRDGQLIYRSPDAQASLAIEQLGTMFDISVDGLPWRVYAEDSADKRSRFAAMTPGSPEAYGLTPWSRSWLAFPLLVSLPLLVIPAWLSVRFALRPWARLSGEIASRGADDLSPLRFAAKHRELSPLTRAVDQWLASLRQARARERHFIADAAHELRTPIAAVQINAEALQQRKLTPEDQSLLAVLLGSNARAGRLVAQLLALTRSDVAPSLRPMTLVDLQVVVQESLAQWAPVARSGQVELDLESPSGATVTGDEESLRTLVDNLVGNAIKHSPPGATVVVKLVRHKGTLELRVIDEGPGIAPALRERVFDRFYRIPGQTQPGSGLGLAIAKTVADRHGASLELDGGPNERGLQVTLRFAASSLTRKALGRAAR
jgi:signal transduction histidine kinase